MNKRTVFASIVVVLGILLALQIRSFQSIDLLVKRSKPGEVFAELRVLQIANESLRAHLEEEKKSLAEATSALSDRAIEDELHRLQLLSGEEAVSGEGVEISFDRSVAEFWITDLMAQLAASGAEAVALNGIRLTEQTAGLREISGGLLMRRNFINPPFHLEVIGPRKDLKLSVAQDGGIIDRIQRASPGLKIFVTEKENIIIPALKES